MLQKLDPTAVWVYGLRCSRGRRRRADVCKALLFLPIATKRFFREDSALTSGLLLFIFRRSGIFNRDLYKYEKERPHFLLSLPRDIGSLSLASLEVKSV